MSSSKQSAPAVGSSRAATASPCLFNGVDLCTGYIDVTNKNALALQNKPFSLHNDCWNQNPVSNAGIISGLKSSAQFKYDSASKTFQVLDRGCTNSSVGYKLCAFTVKGYGGSQLFWLRNDQATTPVSAAAGATLGPQNETMSCSWEIASSSSGDGITLRVPANAPTETLRGKYAYSGKSWWTNKDGQIYYTQVSVGDLNEDSVWQVSKQASAVPFS
jgi:hypothetical protein